MKTALDILHGEMMSDNSDAERRAAYYGQFATSEIFVLLEDEASDVFKPQLVDIDGGTYALTFDTEARLSEFCDEPSPYLSLSGRALVETLDGQEIGVGLNLGVAESAYLFPPVALDWIRERIIPEVQIEDEKITEISAPTLAEVRVLRAIDARLAVYSGESRNAYLVKAISGGEPTHLIVLEGIDARERSAIAGALAETFRFMVPDFALDSMFVESDAAILKVVKNVGLRFDMSAPKTLNRSPAVPGMNPDKPPKLH